MNVSLVFVSDGQLRVAELSFMCVYLVGGLTALVGNGLLATAILKNSALRSNSSSLLAALAASDAVVAVFYTASGVRYLIWDLLGLPPLSIGACFYGLDAPRLFFVFASVVFILACTMDRLIMIKFPLWYSHLSGRLYVGIWTLLALIFASLSVLAMYVNLPEDHLLIPLCEHIFIYQPQLQTFQSLFHLPLSLFIVGINVYSIYFVKEVLGANSGAGKDRHAAYEKSLLIVVRVYICSWVLLVIGGGVQTALWPLGPDVPLRPAHLIWTTISLALFSVNYCANFFIYYGRNGEYRREFRRLLRLAVQEDTTPVMAFSRRSVAPTKNANMTRTGPSEA